MEIIKGFVRVHRGDASALKYESWDWPSVGLHITMKDTNDAM